MSTKSNSDLTIFLISIAGSSEGRKAIEELMKRNDISDYDFSSNYSTTKSIEKLVTEIRLNGGNTIANICRMWEGVDYDEIVDDVADKVGAPERDIKEAKDVCEKELILLNHVLKKYFEGLSEEERKQTMDTLREKLGRDADTFYRMFGVGGAAAIGQVISLVGARVVSRILAQVIGVILARQAAVLAARSATQAIMTAIPFVNIIMGALLVFDVTGPAYRKTVPTVLTIAALRLQETAASDETSF